MSCSLVKGESCEFDLANVSTETILDIRGSGLMQVNIRLGRPRSGPKSHCISSQLFSQSAVCSDAADARIVVSRLGNPGNDNVTTSEPSGTQLLGASRKEAVVPNCQTRMGIRRTGVLVFSSLPGCVGCRGIFCMFKPVPAPGSPTLTHLMRPRSEQKGTICLSVYQ